MYKELIQVGEEKPNHPGKAGKGLRIRFTEKERQMTSLGFCLHSCLVLSRLLILMRILEVSQKPSLGSPNFWQVALIYNDEEQLE